MCVCVQLVVLQKSKEVLLMYDIFSSLCSYFKEKTSKRVHNIEDLHRCVIAGQQVSMQAQGNEHH